MLLSVSFLGFFLAGIILLFSSYRKSKNAYLAAYLLFSNLFSLTYWLIFQSDSSTFSALFAIHITPFYFLTQPFLHFGFGFAMIERPAFKNSRLAASYSFQNLHSTLLGFEVFEINQVGRRFSVLCNEHWLFRLVKL